MRIPLPGAGRTALALLVAAPAVTAFPWQTVRERWVLGVAVAVVLVLFGWWRGLHLTTILRRRLAMSLRGGRHRGAHQSVDRAEAGARTTVVLRVLDGPDAGLPLDLIRGYLDRYGVRCTSLRVTSRDTAAGRTTWLGLTMSARANLAALQARSPDIPLRETAEITLRRLADHLREHGWRVTTSDLSIPDPPGPHAKAGWRAVADGASGYVAVYSIPADSLPDILNGLWSHGWDELWTAIELSAAGMAAGCAIRTEEMPGAPPLTGLIPRRGTQWEALHALLPTSTKPLDAEILSLEGLSTVWWSASGQSVS
ncbi:MAG: type VII secretion protein EccE [Candidatus Nanopelagicales bacterium]